jgi:hypothetical protein
MHSEQDFALGPVSLRVVSVGKAGPLFQPRFLDGARVPAFVHVHALVAGF